MDESLQKNILHELRMIKRLLVHNMMPGDKQSVQIIKLNSIGFTQKEIAEVLGTTSNTVNVALNRQKKAKQKNISKEKSETLKA